MKDVTHSYTVSTPTAFKKPIQDTISKLIKQAALDGKEGDNFRVVVSEVNKEWVIVLLVFIPGKKDPKEYIETILINE